MRKLLVLSVLLLSAATLGAQKIDSRLTSLVPRPGTSATRRAQAAQPKFDPEAVRRDIDVTFNPDGTVQSLSAIAVLKPGAECPTERLESLGISVNDVIGPLVLMQVPPERLYDLEGVGEIECVEADQMNELHTDKAREKTGVDVLDGTATPVTVDEQTMSAWEYAGLPHTYTGKGVVVGIVDGGIDFNHIAFRDKDDNSRVKKVMTGFDKNNNLISYTSLLSIAFLDTDYKKESHGTHVAGIAAGSVVSDYTKRDVRGMAPEADLVLCGLGSSLSDSRIIQSVKGIFQYADSVEKADKKFVPVVVNISLGDNVARHDGLTPCCIAFNELTLNGTKPGRVIVLSAGNAGADKMSIQQTLGTPDADGYQLRTLLKTSKQENFYRYKNGLRMMLYSTEEFDCDLKVVELDEEGKVAHIYPLSASDPANEGEMILKSGSTVYDKTTSGSNRGIYYHSLSVPSDASFFGSDGSNSIYDEMDKDRYVGVFVKGKEGQTIRMVTHPGKATFEGTTDGAYTAGTSDLSINVMACTDAVISVGAYVSRTNWDNYDSENYHYSNPWQQVENGITSFSSYGRDDNGICRPDILAPGSAILSAFNRYDTSTSISNRTDGMKPSTSISPYYYGVMQGTSMSAPCMTGIIALWLEQDPTLSAVDVRRLLRQTAQNDEFTEEVSKIPSGNILQAGMGKVSAIEGMKMLVESNDPELSLKLTLSNASDNTATIHDMNGHTNVTVTLDGRNFYKDGAWNTLCLPFDVNIGESPLNGDGVTVMELDETNSSLSADGTLTLNFISHPVYELLKAGTPYLIKWDNLTAYSYNTDVEPPHTIENPTFRYVTIDATAPKAVTLAGALTFQGTYTPLTVPADGDPTTLYLGDSNTLYYPSSSDVALNAQRAYFHLADGITAKDPTAAIEGASIRSIVLNLDGEEGDATGIAELLKGTAHSDSSDLSLGWYTLQGVRLSSRPTVPGVYLHGGKKVWVK